MATNLSGHSGCRVELVNSGNQNIVIKHSKDKEYNSRLQAQCEKQKRFKESILSAPKVLDSGFDELGLFWFSMEYINGRILADHMKIVGLSNISTIADNICSFIPTRLKPGKAANIVFKNKIDSLSALLYNKVCAEVEDAILKLKNYEWDSVDNSFCHGDMTLENIIVFNGRYYLIDFLDSFYDCWQIDIAKILQDTEINWHYRNEQIDSNLSTRLLILRELLFKKLLSLENAEVILESIYHILLLNLLRILPYAKDNSTILFLEKKILLLNEKLESKDWGKML